jgi:hypothetical protein
MKKFSILFFLFCSTCVFSQDFTFQKMNFDKSQHDQFQASDAALSYVYLFNNFAIAGGSSRSLLYRGEAWSSLNVGSYTSDLGHSEFNGFLVHGFQQTNGDVYALNFAIDSDAFYKWSNVNNNWEVAGLIPSEFSSLSIYVYDETHTFLLGTNRYTDSLEIWQYDNNSFSLKNTYPSFHAKEVWVTDPNHIYFIGTNISTPGNWNLVKYDGLATFSVLYSFPSDCGKINAVFSNDNDNIYFLSGIGNVYNWNVDDENMTTVYANSSPETVLQEQSIFVLSDNELIVSGRGGIAKIDVNTGFKTSLVETDTSFSFDACSYQNGHAIFVSSNGVILEMQVVNAVHTVEAHATMKLFPIPSSNQITVEILTEENYNVSAEIFNCFGQLVRTASITVPTTQLDISDLTSGTYFIRLSDSETGNLLGNKKFVKN